MKTQVFKRLIGIAICMVFIIAGVVSLNPSNVNAATVSIDNTATGDIGGVGADLTDSNTFNILKLQMGIFKRAFLSSDNSVVTSGAILAKGTLVKFLIYVNNLPATGITDLNIVDAYDNANFTYQAASLRIDNNVNACVNGGANDGDCSAAEELNIYNTTRVTAALAEENEDGALVAGHDGVAFEVTAGQTAGNAQLDPVASKVWAMVFEVQIK